ncbi:MAG: Intracellular distribution of mitochondria [Thelocarpon impressellum]|nr:MAG: Intracellular distribution of mitochondria [Thelocarpon impressellum]
MGHGDNDPQTQPPEVEDRDESLKTGPAENGILVEDNVPQSAANAAEQVAEQVADSIFQLTINLPHKPHKIQITEQVQDIRQTITEFPDTFQYSCFHLEHKGQRINEFLELSDVNGFSPESELSLIEDPYTEKDARMHVVRLRELVNAAGDRTDTLLGISAGLSLHDSVSLQALKLGGKAPTDQISNGVHVLQDYDVDAPGTLDTLLLPAQGAPPKTVKAIALSPWNPPPHHLQQRGHLLYLQVTTNEGEQYQITSSVSGFFVNKCSNNKFDPFPRPAPKDAAAHSLLTLLALLSPSFNAAFTALQDFNNQKDPLSTFQLTNAIPASPWLVAPSTVALASHLADLTRSQESFLVGGMENADTLRDWNEEFQSTRELPRTTVQERVFRERLTSKLFADYDDAAARGAVLVARGEVAPLNPTEARDAQIFVYNNIFFSFGADGVGTFARDGGDAAARVATGKDVAGVRAVNQLDIPGLFTPGTVVVDYLGKRLVGQSIVPGIFKQREQGEHQIDYGGVEGKDVVAENETFVPPFRTLSKALRVKRHPVWDKDGQRHDLEGSVETKGLLGTDGRKYVLDLYRTTPLDITWLEANWAETSTAGGSDGHGYPHRMAGLRPELIESFWKVKMRDYVSGELDRRREAKLGANGGADEVGGAASDTPNTSGLYNGEGATGNHFVNENESSKAQEADPLQERIDISGFTFALNPDVFNGQKPQTPEEKEELAQDEKDVRASCEFLATQVLPELISDLNEGDVGFPMDGESLTRLLHKRGINLRYLGKIAHLAQEKEPRLLALRDLAEQEMVSRAFKHIANRHLRSLPAPFAASCLSHLLNCLLGRELNKNPTVEIDKDLRSMYPDADIGFEHVTPETIVSEIEGQVRMRFAFELTDAWSTKLKHLQLLREISLKLGLQLVARSYRFTQRTAPRSTGQATNGSPIDGQVNGHMTTSSKKKKKAADRSSSPASASSESSAQTLSVRPEDIVNIVPIVKDASPKSVLAEEALEAGRISIAQDQKDLGQELLLESLSLHEQIYGILHPEVARVYSQLSMLYYQLDEKNAAVDLARKAVIVSERTLGIDCAETILSYLNLALFEHSSGNTKLALGYIKHALELWKIIYGAGHPDSITTINNAAVMLQHLRLYHESRLWFEASLRISEEAFGKQSPNTATLLYQLAQALALDQDSKGAVKCMREAYNVYLAILGPNDKNTKEAENWLEQLTHNAVSIAKHAKDLQARKLRRVQLTPRVTLGAKPQPQVGQSSTDAANGADPRRRTSLDSRSIDELMRFIEGGGDPLKRTGPKNRSGRGNPKRRGGGAVGAAA